MKTSAARVLGSGLLVCLLAATAASPYPDGWSPFEGRGPSVFRTYPCRSVEPGNAPDGAARIVAYAGSDGKRAAARVRLRRDDDGSVFMSVVDPDGRVLASPQRIADRRLLAPPAFWADMNGDGREDFVALVVTALGETACECDMGFALSSERGYRITGVRSTRGPGANDFLDLGRGRVGFIHTALVERRDPARKGAAPESYFVFSLLEVKGDALVLAEGDPRFPKWVRVAAKGARAAESTLTAAERERLSSEVAARILREADPPVPKAVASATR